MDTKAKEQQTEGTPNEGAPDPIQNLKGEFNRKVGNLEETNRVLMEQLAQVQAMLSKPAAPPSEAKKLEDIWYSSPAEAVKLIKEETTAEIRKELLSENAKQAKQAQTINQLVSDFPELQDQSSELYRKAVEYFDALPADEKSSPLAYKTAVKDAAIDLGVKPKSKRKASSDNDSFTMGSGSSGQRPAQASHSDAQREALAARFGLKVDDAMKARLKQHSKKDPRHWD